MSALALCFALVPVDGKTLRAQSFHDAIRPSLVHLHARGQAQSGPNMSTEVDSYATGFLVSSDGLIVTVYHLISELGDVAPETVTIDARIAEKSANPRRAAIVDASINIDLMLLKIPPSLEPYANVKLGSALDHDDEKPIYTSGFPRAMPYRKQPGIIEGRWGLGGYLWATSFDFKEGQSGSPIYNRDGYVLGLVKGVADGVGYIIPISFADSLLAQVRLREIRLAMKDFELLRKQFSWSGEVNRVRGTDIITVIYEKSVLGEPHVTSIDLKIKPVGIKDDKKMEMNDFPMRNIARKAPLGLSGGIFELDDLWEKVEGLRKAFEYTSITELRLDIVPTLSDDSVLRRKRIIINY